MKSKKRHNRSLDLNQVALFAEVVRAGSFTEAARRRGMPANSVSRNVQQLEAALSRRLLHRSTRKLTLTAAGQAFFDRCAAAISELAQAGQASADDSDLPSGLIRVAAPAGFLEMFRAEWIAEFLASYPQVRMDFVLSDAKADLIAESIDVAIRAEHLVDANHVGHRILETHFSLVASPSYVAARGMPERLESLSLYDCIAQSSVSGPVLWRLKGPDGSREVQVSGKFRSNTASSVMRAAVAGLGIALLPEPIIVPEIEAGHLVRILPGYRRVGADLYAVYISRRMVPRAVSAFVEFAAHKLRSSLQAGQKAARTGNHSSTRRAGSKGRRTGV